MGEVNKKFRISLLLAIDTVFALLELTTGYAVHSLALVADSFHMFNDILSLVVALWAVNVANSNSSPTFSYGLQRAEILGALINAVFLLALCVTILLEAIQRFIDPPEISNPVLILVVGIFGLISNILGLFLFHEHDHGHGHAHGHAHAQSDAEMGLPNEQTSLLSSTQSVNFMLPEQALAREEQRLLTQSTSYGSQQSRSRTQSLSNASNPQATAHGHDHEHDEEHTHESHATPRVIPGHDEHNHSRPKKTESSRSMNMEGVFLHVMGDALGNIGVIITALFIWKTNFSWRFYCDPLVSVFITAIIFGSAVPLCMRASKVLLQATPSSINGAEVAEDIMSCPGVEEIHDLHIWQLSESQMVATLHVTISSPPSDFPNLSRTIQECFRGYGIPTLTIQPEFVDSSSSESGATHTMRQCQSNGNLLSRQ